MAQNIETMKNKYLNIEQIAGRLKAETLEDYLKFKSNGEYEFLSCENCDGPMLGHQITKCTGLEESYDEKTIAKFENWLERIPELKKQLKERALNEADRAARTQAEILGRVMRDTQEARNTTQLVKPRLPPGWSGQRFDKWRAEIEKWSENNRATEEDKFVDLVESLKKNDAVNEFVSKSLLDKIGETRTVGKVLEVLAEKYSKTTCEQIKDTMKKICSSKMSEKVDTLIDNFDEMLMEMNNLKIAERLEYAVSAQFVDRLEENGKINATEKLRLKDILEDQNGKPRNGDTTEQMRRELKRLKIADHREEPFGNRDTTTHYVRNDDRSRYDNWRNKIQSQGFRRSESNPKYFRTASKGRYQRDNSRFGGRSNSRPKDNSSRYGNSRPYRDTSRIKSQPKNKCQPKSKC